MSQKVDLDADITIPLNDVPAYIDALTSELREAREMLACATEFVTERCSIQCDNETGEWVVYTPHYFGGEEGALTGFKSAAAAIAAAKKLEAENA